MNRPSGERSLFSAFPSRLALLRAKLSVEFGDMNGPQASDQDRADLRCRVKPPQFRVAVRSHRTEPRFAVAQETLDNLAESRRPRRKVNAPLGGFERLTLGRFSLFAGCESS